MRLTDTLIRGSTVVKPLPAYPRRDKLQNQLGQIIYLHCKSDATFLCNGICQTVATWRVDRFLASEVTVPRTDAGTVVYYTVKLNVSILVDVIVLVGC